MTSSTAKLVRLGMLSVSGIFVAIAGLLARVTNESNIEHWLVLAAGLSNLVVLFDLGPELNRGKYSKSARIFLLFEMVFFTAVLGVDIKLAFGQWEGVLLLVTFAWVFCALLFMAISEKPDAQVGFLCSALCLVVSMYLIPFAIKYYAPHWDDPFMILVSDRLYAWIHLLAIPFTYFIVDSKLSKDDSRWTNFLFLDMSLVLGGLACAVSGFLYAFFSPIPAPPPLFEAGAAALILLIGNSWYLSILEHSHAN